MINLQTHNSGLFQLQLADETGKNALSHEMVSALLSALDEISQDHSCKTLLLSGNRKYFCTGASADLIKNLTTGDVVASDIDLAIKLISSPVPVIAAMEGSAMGGGLVLALCSDITIAAESERYGFNFTDLGFTPGMGTTGILPDLIGYQRAAEMMMSGKMYKGRELKQSGLFNYVEQQENVISRGLEIAERFLDKPTHVLRTLKKSLAKPRIKLLKTALKNEKEMHAICFDHPETKSQIDRNFLGNL